MLFNSIDFAIFLPVVFILYWFVTNQSLKSQNFLILTASFLFYGWWDWRFLFLLLFSSLVDYIIGGKLEEEDKLLNRRILLGISITINLGFLCFFKYYNFFLENFTNAFSFFGNSLEGRSLDIILPVGISFYTFQTLSYTIDVYRRKLKPTHDLISFLAFVSFFPQLVAGPIERATHLLPQFYKKRKFNYELAIDGLKQILWGLVKKVIIADNCAYYANIVFNNSEEYSGSTLFLGALFFTIQIYCDFSGYSDIAIGTSRLFGFDLMQNFAFPYFSRDVAEFWRRWHISLSTWFRDYLYIPLGGSRGGLFMKIRNTFIIFLVSGFWHGANWTFLFWGGLNAIYFLPLLLTKRNRNNIEIIAVRKYFPNIREGLSMLGTFLLTVLAWIFFRANNLMHAFHYIKGIFSSSFFVKPEIPLQGVIVIFLIVIFMIIEWIGREDKFALEKLGCNWNTPVKWSFYYVLIAAVFVLAGSQQDFIYFQF